VREGFATSKDDIQIHYVESETYDSSLAPLLVVPGMMGIAEHHHKEINDMAPRRCIAFSHRGLGKSGPIHSGQGSFHQRASDIETIARHLSLDRYFLYAFSRGVPIAVHHSLENASAILGLILQDCEPTYGRPSQKWLEHFLSVKPLHIPEATARAYWQDAEKIDFSDRLGEITAPTLFIRGEQPGSLLSREGAEVLEEKMAFAKVVSLPHSAHELAESDFSLFSSLLKNFLNQYKG
jgi:pimeloyl-ACP methyl ester carboxylesterase